MRFVAKTAFISLNGSMFGNCLHASMLFTFKNLIVNLKTYIRIF